MKKTALLIVVITILSKFVGFGREMVLAYFYGASSISDAYLISMTIPTTIFAFISGAIASVFIPMYTQIEAELGVKEADKYTNNLVNILLLICTVLILFGLIFTEQLVKVFALGFEGEILDLAVSFTRVS
ncbi:MAG: lipid II flippase MurJ, partial [Natronincolaceae bacterium]